MSLIDAQICSSSLLVEKKIFHSTTARNTINFINFSNVQVRGSSDMANYTEFTSPLHPTLPKKKLIISLTQMNETIRSDINTEIFKVHPVIALHFRCNESSRE